MRGDPPLIGCAWRRISIIAAIGLRRPSPDYLGRLRARSFHGPRVKWPDEIFALRLAALLAARRVPGCACASAEHGVPRGADVARAAAAQIRAGKTTILVPIGGTEQNGPHMALGKHNVRARALAEKDRRRAGQRDRRAGDRVRAGRRASTRRPGICVIRAPSPSLPTRTAKVLDSAARSFKLAGFRDIVLLGDSGDYQQDDQSVARQLNREWAGSNVRVHAIARVLPRAHRSGSRKRSGSRGYSERRSARTRDSPIRR